MKFAKKIFVGIIALSMLLSCFVLFASAEKAPTLPTDDVWDVLEYRIYDTYLAEDYENGVGDYGFSNKYLSFVKADGAEAAVIEDGENKVLSITNGKKGDSGYKLDITAEEDYATSAVITFDVKVGESGSDFEIVATLGDYVEDITLFAINASSAEDASFEYAQYDDKTILYYTEKAEGVSPELGAWYRVEIVYDLVGCSYSITVSADDQLVFSAADNIGESVKGLDSLKIYAVSENEEAASTVFIDELCIYQGSAVRNVLDAENALADFIIAIDEYARYSETPLDEKLEIAELYSVLFEGKDYGIYYTAPAGIDRYAEVTEVVDNAKSYRNQVYAEAFYYYASRIRVDLETGYRRTYYEIIDYAETYVKEYYDMFAGEDIDSISGMSAPFAGNTYKDAVNESIEAYNQTYDLLETIENYCDNFILTMSKFDANNKNYEYIKTQYDKASRLYAQIDVTYEGIDEHVSAFLALEAKLNAINENIYIFTTAVDAMSNEQNENISRENPYLTINFKELVANYELASTVYKYGSVHSALDNSSYPGLLEHIERYKYYGEYIEERIAECSIFVSMIEGANASTYYVSALNQLNAAEEYLDENKEKSLEDYGTVADAIAIFDSIRERLVKNEKDAKSYIAAVAEIDLEASYAELKAAVVNASALKELGSITGIEGIEEANITFAKAEALVAEIELSSKNLVESVAALKTADSFKERRALIFRAAEAVLKADASIDGVYDAAIDLMAQIEAYDAEIQAINASFAELLEGSCKLTAGFASSSYAADAIAVIVATMK